MPNIGRRPPAAGKGRPKGALNKVTRERINIIMELRARLLENPNYIASVVDRCVAGKAPQLELMVWDRILGKVKDHLRVEHSFDPDQAREAIRAKMSSLLTKRVP